MAKYNFTTAIPYGKEMYEVTGLEYCLWEDIIERAGKDRNAQLWGTYDFLIKQGYPVEEPTQKRNETVSTVEVLDNGAVNSPAINGVPAGTTLVSGEIREKEWTTSKILNERKKLLVEREKIQSLKERALDKKVIQQRALDRMTAVEPASQIESLGDVIFVLGGLAVVGGLIFIGLLLIITKLF